jgi:glutathione peroxidase-family protein
MAKIESISQEMMDLLVSEHDLGPTADGESVYDIPLLPFDSEEGDLITNQRGNVTMIVNVTGECGNSMQYPMLQVLQYDYEDQGFQIVCVPTNDYCEFAYGDFANNSTSTAEEAYNYAFYNYRVRLPFTELVKSRYSREDDDRSFEPHPIYKRLGIDPGSLILGNFEKFIVSRDGKRRARFTNGCLLPANFETGYDEYGPKEGLKRIRAAIEYFLAEEYDDEK